MVTFLHTRIGIPPYVWKKTIQRNVKGSSNECQIVTNEKFE